MVATVWVGFVSFPVEGLGSRCVSLDPFHCLDGQNHPTAELLLCIVVITVSFVKIPSELHEIGGQWLIGSKETFHKECRSLQFSLSHFRFVKAGTLTR